jgi:hypothetical protein
MPRRRVATILIATFILLGLIGGAVVLWYRGGGLSQSNEPITRWFTDPASRPSLATSMNRQACPDAPFILPSDGLIGLLWNDPAAPYTVVSTHTGMDVFGDGAPGTVPVYAAYGGWLSRLADWRSSVIIRHDDPLQPGRTIWTYYTHMASRDGEQSYIAEDFPPGTTEQRVEQGDLLGYQGEYAGAGRAPIGLHIHFSIVLSDDANSFRNEAVIGNTLDPSPYLGMPLNIAAAPRRPIGCTIGE